MHGPLDVKTVSQVWWLCSGYNCLEQYPLSFLPSLWHVAEVGTGTFPGYRTDNPLRTAQMFKHYHCPEIR